MLSRQSLQCLHHVPSRFRVHGLQRPYTFQKPFSRTFHSPTLEAAVGGALQLSHTAFQEIHTFSGLPWYLSIPLTAAAFRIAFLPILYITNKHTRREQQLVPILTAWRKAYQRRATSIAPGGTEAVAKQADIWVSHHLNSRKKAIEQNYKYMKVWQRGLLQASFAPIWLLNAEVIREMAGNDNTAVARLFKGDQEGAAGLIPVESGFLTESFYWIPSLISPDETWLLPLAFAAVSATSAWFGFGRGIRKQEQDIASMERGGMRLRRLFILNLSQAAVVAACVMPVLAIRWELPTAVVLYMLGSVASQTVLRPIIQKVAGFKPLEMLDQRVPKPKGHKKSPQG